MLKCDFLQGNFTGWIQDRLQQN